MGVSKLRPGIWAEGWGRDDGTEERFTGECEADAIDGGKAADDQVVDVVGESIEGDRDGGGR
jgi:hypothetical protein